MLHWPTRLLRRFNGCATSNRGWRMSRRAMWSGSRREPSCCLRLRAVNTLTLLGIWLWLRRRKRLMLIKQAVILRLCTVTVSYLWLFGDASKFLLVKCVPTMLNISYILCIWLVNSIQCDGGVGDMLISLRYNLRVIRPPGLPAGEITGTQHNSRFKPETGINELYYEGVGGVNVSC